MGLRSPVQCSTADAAAQSFLRSAGQSPDAAGEARRRAGSAEVTWRLHRIGGRLVSPSCELRPSLIFKTQAMRGLFLERAGITDTWTVGPGCKMPGKRHDRKLTHTQRFLFFCASIDDSAPPGCARPSGLPFKHRPVSVNETSWPVRPLQRLFAAP